MWELRTTGARRAHNIAAMNPYVGWLLALIAVVVAWQSWGWQGLLFAFTIIVFWLLLQFNRTMRVMRNASAVPVGYLDSAVMLNARLKTGMSMLQVVTLTKSLGKKLAESPETWQWTDPGGSSVTLVINAGHVESWAMTRPEEPSPGP